MFIPRDPVVQNQFCKYGSQTATGATGVGAVVAYAGSVVYLDPAATNQESEVKKMAYNATPYTPFGLLMQKVKTGYHSVHPVGFVMPGDLGSSDAIAQPTYNATGDITGTTAVPVGVAHLGIWDTVHYTCVKTSTGLVSTPTAAILPGQAMFSAANEGKLTNSTVNATGDTTVDTGDTGIGARCSVVQVASVLRGVSISKAAANINNTVLYPIRVKLLV